jgi:hypothetical protein
MKISEVLTGLIAVLSMVFSIVAVNTSNVVTAPLGGVTNYDSLTLGEDLVVGDDATVAKDLILTDNDFCIDFYATSTATQNKMYASSTATIEAVDGVMMFGYGSCAE